MAEVLTSGAAEVTMDSMVCLVHENEAAYLSIGSVHRPVNQDRIPLELIEVRTGSRTGDDGVARIRHGVARNSFLPR